MHGSNIGKQIEEIAKLCDDIRRVAKEAPKVSNQTWSWPTKPMDRIHIDLFGIDNKQFLIMVDSFSKWVDAQVVHKTDAKDTVKCLKHWFSVYGVPNQVVSNNVGQFASSEFSNFIASMGIKHILTADYHQSSNGQAERYVQIIKDGLKDNIGKGYDIQSKVDAILMVCRSTPSALTNETPSKLFFGREMQTRLDTREPCTVEVVGRRYPSRRRQSVVRYGIDDV